MAKAVVTPDSLSGDRPVHPNTDFTPERVVRLFLAGLREPDDPTQNDGLRSAYNLSSPLLRWETEMFEGFREKLSGSTMAPLLGHDEAERGPLDVDDEVTRVSQEIVVTSGEVEYLYEVSVQKAVDGKYDGCWLVRDIVQVQAERPPDFEHMPTVEFDGEEIKCELGANLRDVLLRTSGINPHNGKSTMFNCSGNAVCGTCAVAIDGDDLNDKTRKERSRLSLPPFRGTDIEGLRLSCQTKVYDDVRVVKHGGGWGQTEDEDAEVEPGENGEDVRVDPEEYDD